MKPLVATILACTALVFALGALSAGAQSTGNVAAGKKIFQANCSACHGATGAEGGVGPSLKNETKRKNYQQIVAWIKNTAADAEALSLAVVGDRRQQRRRLRCDDQVTKTSSRRRGWFGPR